jgi:ketosteroid isomerase-like protein
MSQENENQRSTSFDKVAYLLKGIEAWQRGDVRGLVDTYAPDVIWDFTHFEGWPEERVLVGRSAVHDFLATWQSTFSDYDFVVDSFHHVPDGRVIGLCRQSGRGAGSSVSVLMEFAQVWTFRDEMLSKVENYSNRSQALDAVGLSE